jgi:phage shock protein C
MNPRRLYRTRDRRLAGVAGGMAEYIDIDPTIVRILWVLAGFASAGLAILAYVLLAIVIPESPWSAAPAGAQPMWGQSGSAGQGWQPQGAGWQPQAATWPQGTGWQQPSPDWSQAQAASQTTGAAGAAPSWADPSNGWGAAQQPNAWASPAYAPVPQAHDRGIGAAAIVGFVLIAIGGLALLNAVIPGWIIPAATGPMILILLGAAFVLASVRRAPQAASTATPSYAAPTPAPAAPVAEPTPVEEATSVDVPIANPAPEANGPA